MLASQAGRLGIAAVVLAALIFKERVSGLQSPGILQALTAIIFLTI